MAIRITEPDTDPDCDTGKRIQIATLVRRALAEVGLCAVLVLLVKIYFTKLILYYCLLLTNFLDFFPLSTQTSAVRSGSKADYFYQITSGYATWFTARGAIRIAHYDVIDDVITRKL